MLPYGTTAASPRGRSMAYQTSCAPLNVTSAWDARPHFSITRREARCPAAVTLTGSAESILQFHLALQVILPADLAAGVAEP